MVSGLIAAAALAGACTPLAGMDAVLAKPGVQLVMFGERHGSVQIPALFLEAVCAATATKRPLIVAIEHLPEQQAALDAYMRSDGGAAARRRLLATPAWADPGGRASQAMLEMIDGVRRLRAQGHEIRLLAFDSPVPSGTTREREEGMARRLIAARTDDKVLILALTGLGHADRTGFTSAKPPFRSAAQNLSADKALSFAYARVGGQVWECRAPQGSEPPCGVHTLSVADPVEARGIALKTGRPGFDGVYATGATFTPSPPARQVAAGK